MLKGEGNIRMECPLCGKEHDLEIRERVATTIIKDEIVEYKEVYYFCENEKENNEFANGKMLNTNLLNARNAYRKIKGLLTSDEIVDIRKQYGLSQVDLANMLGWGEATISRYESKAIQDESYDVILRKIKNDPNVAYEYLENNKDKLGEKYEGIKQTIIELVKENGNKLIARQMLENIYIKYQELSVFNGGKRLDVDKLSAVINYFALKIKNLYKVRLMKLLWYADSLYCKEYNTSMTGLVYCHNDMGALPEGHREIMNLGSINVVEEYGNDEYIKYHIMPSEMYDDNILSSEEKAVLNRVIKKFIYYNASSIAEYMHEETAYKQTRAGELISYEFAKEIRAF